MQTRYRAAATALLLTATAGLAATGGAAQASGSHHTAAKAAKSLTITITSKKGSVALSDSKIRPGNTVFKLTNGSGKKARGLVQILRLKGSYSILDASSDFGQAFSGGSDQATIDAINRIDDNIVFYGGMEAPKKKGGPARKWAVNIDKAGTYFVVNLDKNVLNTFDAKGSKQKRSLPSADGRVDAVPGAGGVGNAFKPGKHNAAHGWMSTSNKAEEPHFVDLEHVKKGTKNSDITDYFMDPDAPPVPPFAAKDGASVGTGVISPGHTFLWTYDLPKGRYAVMCFWPSKEDGTPHAIMGMHAVFNLG